MIINILSEIILSELRKSQCFLLFYTSINATRDAEKPLNICAHFGPHWSDDANDIRNMYTDR